MRPEMLSVVKERGQGGPSNLGGTAAGVSPAGKSVFKSDPVLWGWLAQSLKKPEPAQLPGTTAGSLLLPG